MAKRLGGESSSKTSKGRNVQRAKRLGGETSRGRTDEGAKRPVTDSMGLSSFKFLYGCCYAPEFRGPKFRSSAMPPNFRGQIFRHYAMPPEFRGPECRSSAMPPNFRNSLAVLCYGNLIIPHFFVIYSVCSICHRSETHA